MMPFCGAQNILLVILCFLLWILNTSDQILLGFVEGRSGFETGITNSDIFCLPDQSDGENLTCG